MYSQKKWRDQAGPGRKILNPAGVGGTGIENLVSFLTLVLITCFFQVSPCSLYAVVMEK